MLENDMLMSQKVLNLNVNRHSVKLGENRE